MPLQISCYEVRQGDFHAFVMLDEKSGSHKRIRICLLGMKCNWQTSLLQKQSNGSHFSVIDIITTRKSPKPSHNSEHQEKLMWWSTHTCCSGDHAKEMTLFTSYSSSCWPKTDWGLVHPQLTSPGFLCVFVSMFLLCRKCVSMARSFTGFSLTPCSIYEVAFVV